MLQVTSSKPKGDACLSNPLHKMPFKVAPVLSSVLSHMLFACRSKGVKLMDACLCTKARNHVQSSYGQYDFFHDCRLLCFKPAWQSVHSTLPEAFFTRIPELYKAVFQVSFLPGPAPLANRSRSRGYLPTKLSRRGAVWGLQTEVVQLSSPVDLYVGS